MYKHFIQNSTWRKVSDMSQCTVWNWMEARPLTLLKFNCFSFSDSVSYSDGRKLWQHIQQKWKIRWTMKWPQVIQYFSSLTNDSSPSNNCNKLGLLVLAWPYRLNRILGFLPENVTFLCFWYEVLKLMKEIYICNFFNMIKIQHIQIIKNIL